MPIIINIVLFALITFSLVSLTFLVAQAKRDNSIMDIVYGPTIALSSLGTLIISGLYSPISILIVTLISLWATRLGVRIYRKNHGKPEDARYAAWRTLWLTRGRFYFLMRSYLQIYLLQGSIMIVIGLPLIIALSSGTAKFPIMALVGTAVMLLGLGLETLADKQLDHFLKRKQAGVETAVIMDQGLFCYSRRPNYFGESLVWLGLALSVSTLPYGYIAFLSPLLITYIVTRITGPMLEAIFINKYPVEYGAYMKRTSYFIPLPRKTIHDAV